MSDASATLTAPADIAAPALGAPVVSLVGGAGAIQLPADVKALIDSLNGEIQTKVTERDTYLASLDTARKEYEGTFNIFITERQTKLNGIQSEYLGKMREERKRALAAMEAEENKLFGITVVLPKSATVGTRTERGAGSVKIMEALKGTAGTEGLSCQDIEKATGLQYATVSNALDKLVTSGEVATNGLTLKKKRYMEASATAATAPADATPITADVPAPAAPAEVAPVATPAPANNVAQAKAATAKAKK